MKKIFTILGVAGAMVFANAQIVINEVYGGGGNSGATYKNDFVELVNRGNTSVTLSGAYLQYGSATGPFQGTGTTPLLQALPDITLNPGQYFLIQQAAGTGGTQDLPTPDFIPPANQQFAMSATNGKIALTSSSAIVTSNTDAHIIDLVGFGTANVFEGSGPAPAPSNSNSISRTNGVDSNNNAADFTAGAPSPRNSSTSLSTKNVDFNAKSLLKNTQISNEIIFNAKSQVKIFSMNGQIVKTASVNDGTSLDVSSLEKGIYIVSGDVDGQLVSQKIIKK